MASHQHLKWLNKSNLLKLNRNLLIKNLSKLIKKLSSSSLFKTLKSKNNNKLRRSRYFRSQSLWHLEYQTQFWLRMIMIQISCMNCLRMWGLKSLIQLIGNLQLSSNQGRKINRMKKQRKGNLIINSELILIFSRVSLPIFDRSSSTMLACVTETLALNKINHKGRLRKWMWHRLLQLHQIRNFVLKC